MKGEYATFTFRETDDEGDLFYIAMHPELMGCMAQGNSPEAALASLPEARDLWLQGWEQTGLPVPEPLLLKSGQMLEFSLMGRLWS